MENNRTEIFLRAKIDKESLAGKIAIAIELEEKLREVMAEIRRMITLEEETR